MDDHSRFAYTEILEDEKKETAAGITVKRVLTDNGSCYRSHAFKDSSDPDITHKRTRPYRPQTNGKVDRFNQLEEWAYARPYTSETERVARQNGEELIPLFLGGRVVTAGISDSGIGGVFYAAKAGC